MRASPTRDPVAAAPSQSRRRGHAVAVTPSRSRRRGHAVVRWRTACSKRSGVQRQARGSAESAFGAASLRSPGRSRVAAIADAVARAGVQIGVLVVLATVFYLSRVAREPLDEGPALYG